MPDWNRNDDNSLGAKIGMVICTALCIAIAGVSIKMLTGSPGNNLFQHPNASPSSSPSPTPPPDGKLLHLTVTENMTYYGIFGAAAAVGLICGVVALCRTIGYCCESDCRSQRSTERSGAEIELSQTNDGVVSTVNHQAQPPAIPAAGTGLEEIRIDDEVDLTDLEIEISSHESSDEDMAAAYETVNQQPQPPIIPATNQATEEIVINSREPSDEDMAAAHDSERPRTNLVVTGAASTAFSPDASRNLQ